MNIGKMTQAELAAFVQESLRRENIDTVLTGGAAVAFYSANEYTSLDIDLADTGFASAQKIAACMFKLGFSRPSKHFVHPETAYIVEFVSGPPSVGEERIEEVHKIKLPTGLLNVISPTDCVKDRLAGFYHWNDLRSLEQAILVAQAQSVDMNNIRQWSAKEGKENEFHLFREGLKS